MTAFVRVRRLCLILIAVAALAAIPSQARATVIQYEAIDLIDLIAGEDLWEYRYFVSDRIFETDQGFSVYFDTGLFVDLQDPAPSAGADWDILTIQPDPMLPDAGFYDALALASGASLVDPFVVSVAWLGGAAGPGSQLFTVNQFDAAGNISVLESGVTVPRTSVPEPSSLLLLSAAYGAAALLARWRPARPRA